MIGSQEEKLEHIDRELREQAKELVRLDFHLVEPGCSDRTMICRHMWKSSN